MSSEVLDPRLREAIELVDAGLDGVLAAGVEPADATDALAHIRSLEVHIRRCAAVQAALIDGIDRTGVYGADGHASAKVMVRHAAHLSDTEAAQRAAMARALRALPEVEARLRAGLIGRCQVLRIARAYANPRVRDALVAKDRVVARLAEMESYRDFDARLTEWVRRVDEDGTADRSQRSHERRDAKLLQDYDGSWTLSGGCASLDGAQLHDIFRHFVDAEVLADWEKARAEHGDAATVDHLSRTDGQRRFDALFAVFQQAASAAAAGGGAQIVTNLVMDLATFERTARRFAGADGGPVDHSLDDELDPPPDAGGDLDDLDDMFGPDVLPESHDRLGQDEKLGTDDRAAAQAADPGKGRSGCRSRGGVRHRCSTIDGYPIDPREAVAQALLGQVRRVVVGADGVVIDLGRRRRLFTGSTALAVRLSSMFCYWPGCHVPVSQCQIDHLLPWGDRGGGSTNPGNGGPACGRHNRLKERGFTVRRDQAGQWHVTRPDGVEIT